MSDGAIGGVGVGDDRDGSSPEAIEQVTGESFQSHALAFVRQEREVRRQELRAIREKYPWKGKITEECETFCMTFDSFENWVEEYGGNDGFLRKVIAHVAHRGTLRGLCVGYMQDYAELWGWLVDTRFPHRWVEYQRVIRGLAHADVMETVPIADASGDAKLMVSTRFQQAAVYDKEAFGKSENGGADFIENLADVLTRISERKRAPVIVTEDAQVVE